MRRTDVVFFPLSEEDTSSIEFHLNFRVGRGQELKGLSSHCPFRSVPVREMALECVFKKKLEKAKCARPQETPDERKGNVRSI